jgi:hypothetical protein
MWIDCNQLTSCADLSTTVQMVIRNPLNSLSLSAPLPPLLSQYLKQHPRRLPQRLYPLLVILRRVVLNGTPLPDPLGEEIRALGLAEIFLK